MTRSCVAMATLALALSGCGGGGGTSGEVVTPAAVTAACDVPGAGQCTTIATDQVSWDTMGGQAAWAKVCAAGASGSPGTVVDGCPAANRVGRCAVRYSSATANAVASYGYYTPAFTAEQADQACARLSGAFTAG